MFLIHSDFLGLPEKFGSWQFQVCPKVFCVAPKVFSQPTHYHRKGKVDLALPLLDIPRVHPAIYSCPSPPGSSLLGLIFSQPLIAEPWGFPVPSMFQRPFKGKQNCKTCKNVWVQSAPVSWKKIYICCYIKIFCRICITFLSLNHFCWNCMLSLVILL